MLHARSGINRDLFDPAEFADFIGVEEWEEVAIGYDASSYVLHCFANLSCAAVPLGESGAESLDRLRRACLVALYYDEEGSAVVIR
jgi:hypothetical protein